MQNSEKTRLTIRMDLDRNQKAEQVANNLGIDLTAAVNLFISQMIKENGIPFKPSNNSLAIDLDHALADVKNGDITHYSVNEFTTHLNEVKD